MEWVRLIFPYRDRFADGEGQSLVQNHDVYPTILGLAGIEWDRTDAHNCESLKDGNHDKRRVATLEEIEPNFRHIQRFRKARPQADYSRFDQRLRAVQVEHLKLIRGANTGLELYDLAADPEEGQNLQPVRGDECTTLEHALDKWLESSEHYKPPQGEKEKSRPLSPKDIETLRGLGYF
jgi:arylsulfatase A-like enzyme